MKKYLLVLGILLLAFSAFAIPQQIYFQGILLDDNDEPVTGSHGFAFRIYDAASGGNQLWQEIHSSVPVSNGLYTVKLGSVTPLNSSVFEGNTRYIGIQVDSDAELSPRVQLLSVPFAFRAQYAETAAGAISTGEADARYVKKAGDTMTGTLTMGAGVIRSNVADSMTARGFVLRTNNELKTANPATYQGASLLSIYSGADSTDEALSVFQLDYDASNKFRGMTIPSYLGSPSFYVFSGLLSGTGSVMLGNPFLNSSISIDNSGRMGINAEALALNARITSEVTPRLDNTYDLGRSSPQLRWKDVYAVTYHGDGSQLTGIGGYTTSESDAKYVFKAGDTMTGVLTLQAQAVSTVVSGIPPFVISSTDPVINLNADMLDYYDASDFAMASDVNNRVLRTGDTMTGTLTISSSGILDVQTLIDGVNVNITGPATVSGVSYLSGDVKLGDASTDRISVSGEVNTDVIPSANVAYDIGSSSRNWKNIYAGSYQGGEAILTGTVSAAAGNGVPKLIQANSTNTNPEVVAVYGALLGLGSNKNYGGYFETNSTQGVGVCGKASLETFGSTTYGGYFESGASMGVGVYGEAKYASGLNYGGYFKAASPAGYGLYAVGSTEGYAGRFDGDLRVNGSVEADSISLQEFAYIKPLSSIDFPIKSGTPEGTVWYDNDTNKLRVYTTSWEALN